MDKQNKNPNKVKPETLARVIHTSQTILNIMGVETTGVIGTNKMLSATLPLDKTELSHVPEGATPSVSITKPAGDFAKKARWSYEITYSLQDPSASRHVLVMNDEVPAAEMAFYDGSPDRPLTEDEAQIVAADLGRLTSAG